MGIRTLRDWLLEPAPPAEIQGRQQAVAELAPHLELRQTLTLEGRLLTDRGRAAERFVEWAESDPWLAARPWLRWLCRIASAAAMLIVLLACLGVLPAEPAGVAFFAVLCINVNIIVLFGGRVEGILSVSNLRRGEAARYLRMFQTHVLRCPTSNSELGAVKREATNLGGGVLLRMRQLKRVAILAGIRHEPFFNFFVYLPLQFFFPVRFSRPEPAGSVASEIRRLCPPLVRGAGEV